MIKLSLALHNGIRILTSLLFQCLSFNYSVILEEFLIMYFNAVKEEGFVCGTVRITQLCPTLCDLMDCSLPGSSVHGIL